MLAIKEKTLQLIDALKATCQSYGMGNDGNEYKIITQVFLALVDYTVANLTL